MSRSSRSVYTVTRSTYLPRDDEMSDIAYIDVDDDDDYVDSDLHSTKSTVKPTQGNLYEVKRQVSDHLSERGIFDYFSSPLTNRAQEPSFRPQNHNYLGPGGSSSVRSSGARKFVEAHGRAETMASSDEEVRGSSYESRWSTSSHKHSVDDSPSLDSQWVRQQYNQHVRQANTQCYDDAVLCDDPEDCLTENRPLSPVSSKQAARVDFLSSRSSMRDSEHVLSRPDVSHDVCDSFERLKSTEDPSSYRDSATLRGDSTVISCGAEERCSSPATQSFLLRSGGRRSKDISDTVSHHLSSPGQLWPILARSCDSCSVPAAGSHQNAVCRSSELSTVVSSVGSVRCSTGVDTGVGFPLSTVSSRGTQGHTDSSRLSSSGQSTITSGLDRVHWAASNGLQAIADYHRNFDCAGPRSYIGRSAKYEPLTFRKNSQDDDSSYTYGSRGNESDGDDDARRRDADITCNVDILQRRGKDYDGGSTTTMRPVISSPQYHLMPTEEEETERRQSAKGQLLERMQRRRNARLNRQSAGVSAANTVPGFRGEASLEELINYIDAPALTAGDCKTVRKSKKKKKKISTAGISDTSEQKLANSCEVFVGISGVSSDEPSVRVGDSCYIELRKKSDFDSLPGTRSTPVDPAIYSPNSLCSVDLNEEDKNVLATSTTTDGDVDPNVVDSQNTPNTTETNHLNVTLVENLSEVVYAEVKNTLFEEEDISENFTESVTTTVASEETLAVNFETALSFQEGNSNENHSTTDIDLMSVESGNPVNMTDSIGSLSMEDSTENVGLAVVDKQHELDSILPLVTGSDSVTSDTGSVEDLFVTVQKKKRAKNPAVSAEDLRQRFGRRSSTKGADDRDGSYYVKRSWVKSSDTASIVPSISVSRSSIIYSKPSCPVSQRSSVAVAQYSQASSNPDTVLSSAAAEKWKDKSSSSAASVKAEFEGITEQNIVGERMFIDSACMSKCGNNGITDTTCRSGGNKQKEFESNSATRVTSHTPADGATTTHWQTSGLNTLVCDRDNKTESCISSDTPIGTRDAACCASNAKQKASIDVTAGDTLNECAIKTDVQVDNAAGNLDVSSRTGEDQSLIVHGDEGNVKSSGLSVDNAGASDVFLDTRNIAGTTPPRSDISFGFDPSSSPESSDLSLSQHINTSGGAFNAVAASSPVVAPVHHPPVAGAPILYFYPAMPVTILPPVATFATGRCTPIGVVPPMPAVADVSNICVAPPTWQSAEDKVISVPAAQDEDKMAVNDETVASDARTPSISNNATNVFVLSAAQRYLYTEFEKVLESSRTGLPHECLVVHYSSLEALQQH